MATPKDQALVIARAELGRAAEQLRSAPGALGFERANRDLDDVLSALAGAGYRVTGNARSRPLSRSELARAIDDLAPVPDLIACGAEVEELCATVRARLTSPGSPVLERLIAAVSAAARPPLSEHLAALTDDLSFGMHDDSLEQRRAIELAFSAALEWTRLAAVHQGEEGVALGLASLASYPQAGYLAGTLANEYAPHLPEPSRSAALAAAEALELARGFATPSAQPDPVDVADKAAVVLAVLVALDAPEVYDLAADAVNALRDSSVRKTHDLR